MVRVRYDCYSFILSGSEPSEDSSSCVAGQPSMWQGQLSVSQGCFGCFNEERQTEGQKPGTM